jgi:hypothetical protein
MGRHCRAGLYSTALFAASAKPLQTRLIGMSGSLTCDHGVFFHSQLQFETRDLTEEIV